MSISFTKQSNNNFQKYKTHRKMKCNNMKRGKITKFTLNLVATMPHTLRKSKGRNCRTG